MFCCYCHFCIPRGLNVGVDFYNIMLHSQSHIVLLNDIESPRVQHQFSTDAYYGPVNELQMQSGCHAMIGRRFIRSSGQRPSDNRTPGCQRDHRALASLSQDNIIPC